jgi:mRNA interferase MazF
MRRGELYRVVHPSARDPKKFRVFVVVSRQVLLDSRFSTVICAPIYTAYDALATQVPVGPDEGLKHESSVHCDELVSLPKSVLTDFIGTLSPRKINALNQALQIALDLPGEDWESLT